MTFERRAQYEYGDEVTRAEARDHALAPARGQRLADLADAIVDGLLGRGILPDPATARVVVFGILADALYGNASIDIPDDLRKKED